MSSHPLLSTTLKKEKRKYSEVIDLTETDSEVENAPTAPKRAALKSNCESCSLPDLEPRDFKPKSEEQSQSQSQGSENSQRTFEDLLDGLKPYQPQDGQGTSPAQVATLHHDLRKIGAESFMAKYLGGTSTRMTARRLGEAFGLDPSDHDDETHMRLLAIAIFRVSSKRQKLAQFNTLDDAVKLLQKSQKIIVVTGAGISTSLGIPDFRSKNTGFYAKVQALGYEDGQDVFDIYEFDRDPGIFYSLAGDILPDLKRYSPTHAFVKLLQDKGRLQTNYTQNIDNLEALAGIHPDRLIQCHGSFATAACRKCNAQVPGHTIFEDMRAHRVARCKTCLNVRPAPIKKKKARRKPQRQSWEDSSDEEDQHAYDIPEAGVMKPDITFFGEQLPNAFFDRLAEHGASCDLVIVIGTSLKVRPVSEMPHYLPHHIPHINISRDPIDHVAFDIQLLGDCDDIVVELCRRAGWDFTHEMIPPGIRTVTTAVTDSEHMWRVKRAKDGAGA